MKGKGIISHKAPQSQLKTFQPKNAAYSLPIPSQSLEMTLPTKTPTQQEEKESRLPWAGDILWGYRQTSRG
jgi:hypothetical protein